MVSNGTILAEKIVALTAAMGVDPDFTKTYSEHFATEEPVVDDPNGNDTDDHNTNGTITIIIVIAGAVVLLAGAVAVGPVLQGLGAPVNDLSRGCLVEDIYKTIIMTCNQAIGLKNKKN